MSRIEVNNLRKVYDVPNGKEVAVQGISLEIPDTNFLTLLGPSGCGKTTTLRCIAGLETPTEGTIRYDQDDVTEEPAQERDISMVFQEIALYPHMSCLENIAYPLKVRGIEKEERHERARSIAEKLEVGELVEKYPAELSGGQRQRIAIARAIVRNPRAFLMDEPMTGLDEKLKVVMRKELKRIIEETEQTVVYVTHSQEEAMMLSDQIAVMNDGQVEQVGPPDEVYSSPNNRFVATFVGMPEMNIWNGTVNGEHIQVKLGSDQELMFRPQDVAAESQRKQINSWDDRTSDTVEVGFRPQALSLAPRDSGDICAELRLIEPMGENNLCYLELDDREIRVVTNDVDGFTEGNVVGVHVDRDEGYVFDDQTGSTIARTGQQSSPATGENTRDYAATDD